MDDPNELDALEPLLRPMMPVPEGGALRQELLQQTTRVVRRHRRRRRLARVAVVAACYAAGLATMYLIGPRPAPPMPTPSTAPPIAAVPAPLPVAPHVLANLSAAELEQA